MKINIASWNIWVNGSRDFKGVVEVVKENKIDIIGIQEAAIYFDKGKENAAEEIAKELKFNFAHYPAVDRRPERPWIQENAIFSRFPIVESEFYLLNPPTLKYDCTYQTEPRILVHSKIQLDKNKMLSFLTTHLQFSVKFETTDIRIFQVEKILSVIKKLENPIVLTGDFNTIPKTEEIIKIEKLLAKVDGNEPTWTLYPWEKYGWRVDGLKYRLDNIFLSKDISYQNFKVIQTKISDHLPIKVTIDV